MITVSQIDRELVAHEEQQPDTIPNRSNTEPQQQKVLVHSKIERPTRLESIRRTAFEAACNSTILIFITSYIKLHNFSFSA